MALYTDDHKESGHFGWYTAHLLRLHHAAKAGAEGTGTRIAKRIGLGPFRFCRRTIRKRDVRARYSSDVERSRLWKRERPRLRL